MLFTMLLGKTFTVCGFYFKKRDIHFYVKLYVFYVIYIWRRLEWHLHFPRLEIIIILFLIIHKPENDREILGKNTIFKKICILAK